MMKKKLISAVVTGAMCASMMIPAMAETTGGAIPTLDGTDVYAGITLDDPDAKVKVEVPTLFAFVVNGTVTADASAVTSSITDPNATDPTILLPNIRVKVDEQSGSGIDNGKAHLETEASGNWSFTNYSTKKGSGANSSDGRVGLAVKIVGSIRNEGTDASRNYWTHVANADTAAVQGSRDGFKKYTLEVDGQRFNKGRTDGSFEMENPVDLEAPDVVNGGVDKVTKFATVGSRKDATFNVYVGGQRDQYSQVEESAKVGSIVWTIQGETQSGVPTAGNNAILTPPAP